MLSQDLLITDDSQDITLLPKEKNHEKSTMNCEDFQDLDKWCSQPLTGNLQTPAYTDRYELLPFIHDSLEIPKVEDGPEYNCEDWLKFSVEEVAPAENQVSTTFGEQASGIMDHNIGDDIYINYYNNGDEAKPENLVFDDLPAYEEIIEISSSDSVDYMEEKMEQFETVTVIPQETLTWDDKQVRPTNDASVCEYALKNNEYSFSAATPIIFSALENKNTYFVDTLNNDKMENPEIEYLNYDDVGNYGIILSPLEVKQNNDTIIDTIIIDDVLEVHCPSPVEAEIVRPDKLRLELKMNKQASNCNTLAWNNDNVVTTPDVLRTIEQLENDNIYNTTPTMLTLKKNDDTYNLSTSSCFSSVSGRTDTRLTDDQLYELTPPDTPKSNVRKRRLDCEDSDESYTPLSERVSRKKSKMSHVSAPRKTTGLAKELLDRLNTPVKRGRPPKRRDSVSSSGTYLDDNNSVASHEDKYRERRDKNNEASRRSRYQRKRKDLETVNAADEMEARNEVLREQAIRLERKAKLLRDVFLAVLANKK